MRRLAYSVSVYELQIIETLKVGLNFIKHVMQITWIIITLYVSDLIYMLKV